jgi:hypothetical protein
MHLTDLRKEHTTSVDTLILLLLAKARIELTLLLKESCAVSIGFCDKIVGSESTKIPSRAKKMLIHKN